MYKTKLTGNLKKTPKNIKFNFKNKGEVLYSWRTKEFTKTEKGFRWYVLVTFATLFFIAVAAWTQNPLMAVTFILMAFVILIYSNKEPRTVEFKITSTGIEADTIFYQFNKLKSFWIFYHNPPRDAYISISRKTKYLPYLQIPIGDADPSKIRKLLLKHLKEKEHLEELSNIAEKLLKL